MRVTINQLEPEQWAVALPVIDDIVITLFTRTKEGANALAAVFDSYVVKAQAIRADVKVKPAADVARSDPETRGDEPRRGVHRRPPKK